MHLVEQLPHLPWQQAAVKRVLGQFPITILARIYVKLPSELLSLPPTAHVG